MSKPGDRLLPDLAGQARAVLLATAADPREPFLAREAYRPQVAAATGRLARLVRRRPRRQWRTAAVGRLWLDVAVDAYFYRFEWYQRVEQQAWAVVSALPATRPGGKVLRRLREQVQDADVLADYALSDLTAATLRAADTFRAARRRIAADPLAAALAELATGPRPADTTEDRIAWPMIDQRELRNRVEQDMVQIRLGAVLAGDRRSCSAQRQLEPWLQQLANTLTTPLSAAALELACAQWREQRAPYVDSQQPAQVQVSAGATS